MLSLVLTAGLALSEDVPVEPQVPEEGPVHDGAETVPPESRPVDLQVGNWMLVLVAIALVSGALATYAPREVRKMRMESAQREYMDARLSLAQGDFVSALVGFDSAIEEAQRAYTRRDRVNGPAEWVILPDEFYINLWRGRAMALRGIGRERLAEATFKMVDELESSVVSSGPLK
jgi:hypothetical protein